MVFEIDVPGFLGLRIFCFPSNQELCGQNSYIEPLIVIFRTQAANGFQRVGRFFFERPRNHTDDVQHMT